MSGLLLLAAYVLMIFVILGFYKLLDKFKL